MSGHPQGGQYDDGYGHSQGHAQPQGQDAYYHDDQQYGQYHDDARGQQGQYQQNGNDAYYDEQYVLPPGRPMAPNANTAAEVTMTANTNRTADTMTSITASNRVAITKMNTTMTSITTRVVLKRDMLPTPRAVSLGVASMTLRRTLRPSATSQ